MKTLLSFAWIILATSALHANDADWAVWRGPDGNGISRDRDVPVRWSEDQNRIWKAEIPGRGHSTPIVVGDQVILTTADEQQRFQSLLSYRRSDGKPLWNRVIHRGGFTRLHKKNSHASATPCSDGQSIYCVFIHDNGLHVTATDLKGSILWQKKVGDFTSEHGYGSSPAMYKDLLIVNGDNMSGCFVAAIDRTNGEIRWKTERKTTGRHGSYATPSVTTVGGKPQLLLMGMETTSSYDPDTGKLLWQCLGPAEVTACTVATSHNLVIATGGYPEKEIMAIRADGSGTLGDDDIVWRAKKGVTYVPSPLIHNDRLFIVADNGIASCFELDSGRVIWQERLGKKFSASPTLAGDLMYVPSEDGTVFVIKAADDFEVVAKNRLGVGGFASPVICGGRIYLRTNDSLYCIGAQ